MSGRVVRLLTLVGVLRARVCRLCAALVAADGAEQHERYHAATLRPEEST